MKRKKRTIRLTELNVAENSFQIQLAKRFAANGRKPRWRDRRVPTPVRMG